MSGGVQIGLKSLYYALLSADTSTGVTYKSAPIQIPGAITANINPNSSIDSLFADDGPIEVAAATGEIELELVVADLPVATQATLLGHYVTTSGIVARGSADTPPWVAVGFKSLKSNGSYRYVWLVKGKFMVPEEDHKTRGDAISFQTPTIVGAFVKRDYDGVYQIVGDEDETGFAGASWFTKGKIEAGS